MEINKMLHFKYKKAMFLKLNYYIINFQKEINKLKLLQLKIRKLMFLYYIFLQVSYFYFKKIKNKLNFLA